MEDICLSCKHFDPEVGCLADAPEFRNAPVDDCNSYQKEEDED